ncbi:MAG: hypothetical protein IBX47_04440 [Desulfuromonadales bacterium]|nr:hypothetical protein [Desulfuromonadales bacterium]
MKLFKMIVSTVLLAALLSLPAIACTGKTITIARTADLQQVILAQMLAVLIDARTGTTVEEKIYPTFEAAHAAIIGHDADIDIEYTGRIRAAILNKEMLSDADELFAAVKEEYAVSQKNLIILPRLGFNNQTLAPAGGAAEAVIVLRKDTAEKFPALDKLITKLAGIVDDAAMQELEKKAQSGEIRTVVREFLRSKRLLF